MCDSDKIPGGQDLPARRRSQVPAGDSTNFAAARRKPPAEGDEQDHLFMDYISPAGDGDGFDMMAQSTQRQGFRNEVGFAHPHLHDNRYSQRQTANQKAAASPQPRLVETNDIVGTTPVRHSGGLPSPLLDPPFLSEGHENDGLVQLF